MNRTVEWDIERGIVYRADRKHVHIIAKDMGIEMSSNGVDAPGAKAEAEDPENDVSLVSTEATKFRAIAAGRMILHWTVPTSSTRPRKSAGPCRRPNKAIGSS